MADLHKQERIALINLDIHLGVRVMVSHLSRNHIEKAVLFLRKWPKDLRDRVSQLACLEYFLASNVWHGFSFISEESETNYNNILRTGSVAAWPEADINTYHWRSSLLLFELYDFGEEIRDILGGRGAPMGGIQLLYSDRPDPDERGIPCIYFYWPGEYLNELVDEPWDDVEFVIGDYRILGWNRNYFAEQQARGDVHIILHVRPEIDSGQEIYSYSYG